MQSRQERMHWLFPSHYETDRLFKTTVITSFKKMFEEADDISLPEPIKPGSSSEQVAYFDAMRDMRLNKKNIESIFSKALV